MLADQSGLHIGPVSLASKLDDNFNFLELICKMIFIVLGSSSINSTTFGCVLIRVLARILFWGMIMINTKLRLSVLKIMALVFGLMLMFFFSNCSKSSDQTNQQGNVTLSEMASKTDFSSVGKHVKEEGELEILVEDDFQNKVSRTRHFLKTVKGRIELKFKGHSPQLVSGSKLQVTGEMDGQALALSSTDTASLIVTAAAPLANTVGELKILVLLINFQDDTRQPMTVAQANDTVFTQANNFFKENSFQQIWITGDTVGYYTLPMSIATSDTWQIRSSALQAATDAGVNIANYNHFIYVHPYSNRFPYGGFAPLGGNWVDINGLQEPLVFVHELGHNLGLMHAHSQECAGASVGSSCSLSEYGDVLDAMGMFNLGHFGAFQKERLGWLNYATSPAIVTVTSGGTFSLESFETASGGGFKALKILKSVDAVTGQKSWYYVEYRQAIALSDRCVRTIDGTIGCPYGGLDPANILSGVVIHTGADGDSNSSILLDMTPASSLNYDWSDPALITGKTFIDGDRGISISTLSAGGSTASVSVAFGPPTCVRANPSIVAGARYNTGPNVTAGTAVSFPFTVINSDSSLCSTASFNLSTSIPSGWTASSSPAVLNLSPGASSTVIVTATSPSSAVAGSHALQVTASNAQMTTASTSSTVYYQVSTSTVCERSDAWVVVSPAAGPVVSAGTPVLYSMTVVNADSSACGSSNFNLKMNYLDSRLTATFSPATQSLNPGAAGVSTITVNSDTAAPIGIYQMVASPTDAGLANYYDARGAFMTYQIGSLSPPPGSADTTAPTVTLTNPINGATVARNKVSSLAAAATDNLAVIRVEFFVNNKLICTDIALPYVCSWKVPASRNATYLIKATAYDAAGNASSATSTVTAR